MQILLADCNTTMDRTEWTTTSINEKQHTVLVLDLHGTPALIGTDLFDTLHIQIVAGNPYSLTEPQSDLFSEAMEHSIDTSPMKEEEKLQLQAAIHEHIDANQKTAAHFCNLATATNIRLQGFTPKDAKAIRQ